MRNTIYLIVFSAIIFLLTPTCGIGWQKLEKGKNVKYDTLLYSQLPKHISTVYDTMYLSGNLVRCISSDTAKLKITGFNVSADAEKKTMWPYGDYIRINNKKIFLSRVPPKPGTLAIDSIFIYWPTEFNTRSYNYKKVKYCRISWN